MQKEAVHVSATERIGLTTLEQHIESFIQLLFNNQQSPFILNQRQINIINEIDQKLISIVNSFDNHIHYELVAHQLKELLENIAHFTGKNISEEILTTVFNQFCIGK
jgi:tRNA U34 5-carboxymethylaminomethyl modifying GTPase MnmE/TrmE